jgi:hypothetical protein
MFMHGVGQEWGGEGGLTVFSLAAMMEKENGKLHHHYLNL